MTADIGRFYGVWVAGGEFALTTTYSNLMIGACTGTLVNTSPELLMGEEPELGWCLEKTGSARFAIDKSGGDGGPAQALPCS